MEPIEIAAEVQAIVDAEFAHLEKMVAGLNKFLRNMWQIDWVGQFQDVCSGDGEFPAKVRESFSEDGYPISAIPEDMIDSFKDFLRSYGF